MIQSAKLMAKTRTQQAPPRGPKITVGPEERARIKEMREQRGLLQKDLARRVGATQGTISNLESGRHPQIYLSVYQRILSVLRMEGAAQQTQDYYRRIVEGAAELNESDQRAVATLIDSLKKARAS